MKKEKKEGLIKGFINFISKGNIIDLAVAVVMGAAFGAIVKSFIDHILMPLFAAIFGGKGRFEDLTVTVNGSIIEYGKFLNAVVYFLLIALFIYIFIIVLVKGTQKRLAERQKQEEAEKVEEPVVVEDPADVKLLKEIKEELTKLNEKK